MFVFFDVAYSFRFSASPFWFIHDKFLIHLQGYIVSLKTDIMIYTSELGSGEQHLRPPVQGGSILV